MYTLWTLWTQHGHNMETQQTHYKECTRSSCSLTSFKQQQTAQPSHDVCQESSQDDTDSPPAYLKPFPNVSSFHLANWYWNSGNKKSLREFQELLTLLQKLNFSLSDALEADYCKIILLLGSRSSSRDCNDSEDKLVEVKEKENGGQDDEGDKGEWIDDAGWRTSPVVIPVPFHKGMRGSGVQWSTVGALHHRNIIEILQDKVRSTTDSPHFHYQPYYIDWDPGFESDTAWECPQVHGKLYTSEAFVEAHQALQSAPKVPGCDCEWVIAALMFWSDATKLTEFSPTKLWPCYMFFGNESKYRHTKPSLNLGGKLPPQEFMTHCAREVFHAQWSILLDDDLVEAMTNGIVLMCHDNVERQFYPKIFTYSADYPEKVMIAVIKQNSKYPCMRCLIPKCDLHNMETPEDLEFQQNNPRQNDQDHQKMLTKALSNAKAGFSVTGDKVMGNLEKRSMLPVQALKFNIFPCLVMDLLHEFEIWVWKNTFKHLIRLLVALKEGPGPIAELDQRYRNVPPFCRSMVQRFLDNASEMKYTTIKLSSQFRKFKMETCDKFNTVELPKKTQARAWRNAKNAVEGATQVVISKSQPQAPLDQVPDSQGSNLVNGTLQDATQKFNLSTYKYHALGDYASNIHRYGTTDSFTSKIGELSHQQPKTWYKQMDRKRYRPQIAGVEQRRAQLRRIKYKVDAKENPPNQKASTSFPGLSGESSTRYYIGTSKEHLDITKPLQICPTEYKTPLWLC
ncbi:hypothetical protein FA15DRAFT_661808 [Coprinopsis marcescibilis]|uniref:Uncharacterized protein n=1 Tax=Coprinopsis marcescibilis TaxID=230819 RepID=A0A5C3KAP0_COPMA|nr:hypothetical protein FA15DRAFT_661808 [Coprinopsis marcescibilis]